MENFSEATLPSEEIVSCGEGDEGCEGQRIERRHQVAAVLASERVARRSPAPRGSDDGTVATRHPHEKKKAQRREGFFDASRAGRGHRAASRDRVHARGRTLPVARAFMSCILSCCWGGC